MTPAETAPSVCLHRLFEEQARRRPGAAAVVCGEVRLTYAELDRRADRIARRLLREGLAPETPVGVCLGRSVDLVAAILGVLKAGGAYVPVDPDYPRDRVEFLLEDARAPVLVTSRELSGRLPGRSGRMVFVEDAAEDGTEGAPAEVPSGGDRLAYVIYTSGSTGRPKGVMVTHGSVSRLFPATRGWFDFGESDVWTLFHSVSFGFSAWELWGALLHGGTLVVVPYETSRSPSALAELVRREGVTVLCQTPSAFRSLVLGDSPEQTLAAPSLRWLILSGEAIVLDDLRRWFAARAGAGPRVADTYAITEAGGQVACRLWTPADLAGEPVSGIGALLPDTRALILDDAMAPAPAGQVGELYLGGPGLARGYLHQPGLTAEKFAADPRRPGPDGRLYKTGDLARLTPGGGIALAGRADDQVKIRGFRVGLAEIEAALREHPDVREAAVVVDEPAPGDKRLAAYVALRREPGASASGVELWPSLGEYQIYDDLLYHIMTNEEVRNQAFREAIARIVPGKVVLDIGTGQDAILARFCAEAGARKVYAVEVLEEACARAAAKVKSLGLDGVITVLQGDSLSVELPEKADVVTEGIIGNIGSSDGIVPIMNDARRLLKEGAVAIPCRCTTLIAPVSLPEDLLARPAFAKTAAYYADRLFEQAGREFDVRLCVKDLPPSRLLSAPATFEDLDFSGKIDPEYRGSAAFTIARDGPFDGFLLWTLVLADEKAQVDYLANQKAWLPIYFPAFCPALTLAKGDRIEASWRCVQSPNGFNPDYELEGRVLRGDGRVEAFSYVTRHHETAYKSTGIHRGLFANRAQTPAPATAASLRAHLAERLPQHMLPASFSILDALPLGPNGKLDRAALPPPDAGRASESESYVAPRNPLETALAELWAQAVGVARVGIHDNFFELGGDSIRAIGVTNKLQTVLKSYVYIVAILDAPTVAKLADYLVSNYRDAVLAAYGPDAVPAERREAAGQGASRVSIQDVERLKGLIKPRHSSAVPVHAGPAKNPRAVFILTPPRSGSTLLRVMLAGHPDLFSPPELELLHFNTMREHRAAFSGRDELWLEGAWRTVMQLKGCGLAEAQAIMADCERRDMSVKDFYGQLQRWAAPRLFIEKSTYYALDPRTLRRTEEFFEDPLYIHLTRHPAGMIRSYEEINLQFFFPHAQPFAPRQLAELTWDVSHQNILDLLAPIPARRRCRVSFEELVADPRRTMERLSAFMGVEFHPGMIDPYQDRSLRMTDATKPGSKMVGDPKFFEHRGIVAGVAERWRETVSEGSLGEPTVDLARSFGYAIDTGAPAASAPRRPLSFAQERLWFLEQLHPGDASYNLSYAWRLRGALDEAALRRSLDELTRRHEVLRTFFAATSAGPVQAAAPARAGALPAVEASKEDLERRLSEEGRRVFDLARGPLLRQTLYRLGPREHALQLTFHHIAVDGWSIGILCRELAALYGAFAAGRPSPLPEPPAQYADFAVRQRERLMGGLLDAQTAYWKERLRSPLPRLELPSDRSRPAVESSRGGQLVVALPASLADALKALARRQNATLFMACLAAFKALLHRCTGQTDVIVGTPATSRHEPGLDGLVGLLINTLALRTDLSGDPSFAELVRRVRETAAGAYAHQDLPFEKLVAQLNPDRDLSQPPVVQVLFVLQNFPPTALDLSSGALETAPIPVQVGASHVDMTFSLRDTGEGLKAVIDYKTDLFDRETVARLVDQFRSLAEAAAARPETRLSELPLVPEEELRRALAAWNDTAADYPRDATVHGLFQRQAAATPKAVALEFEGRKVTYAELEERSERLASRLREAGAGPGGVAALCVERSPAMVVGLLAILKSGAAYLPLDPRHPEERRAFFLADSGAGILLTEDASGEPEIARLSPGASAPPDTACVIYTSGSTGRPKGVAVRQSSLVNLLTAMRAILAPTPADALLAVTTVSFDIATLELFLPLLAGARVVLAPRETVLDGAKLAALLETSGATIMQATPTTWRLLVEAGWRGSDRLRLLSGGEVLTRDLAEALLKRCGSLWNGYGPTETTIYSTMARVASGAGPVPIGRPLANTRVYILDGRGRPVPALVTGELHIGGDGVAAGYLGRPELTAEKFLPDGFGAGGRLYRTGDLARRLPDGTLEFLGRADNQIKLRGHRIELEEIESVLREHPSVLDAAVAVDASASGDPRLTACIVPRGKAAPGSAALRDFLRRRLPEVMVPSAFATLPALPQTSSGKVDRKALPRPTPPAPAKAKPTIPLHYQLIAVWERVLGVSPVDLDDDFFELGGHSLLAVRLINEIEADCGRRPQLTALFSHSTVARLAERMLEEDASRHVPILKLQAGGTKRPLFFLHGDVIGGGFYCLNLARHLGPDQPLFVLPPLPEGGTPGLPDIAATADRHLRELRSAQPRGPYRLGGFCAASHVAYEMARRLSEDGETVEALILIEAIPSRWPSRAARRVSEALRRLLGLDATGTLSWFNRWSEDFKNLKELRLRILLGGLFRRLTRPLRPAKVSEPGEEEFSPAEIDLMAGQIWASAGYLPPRSYRGPLTLLATPKLADYCADPAAAWAAWAGKVCVRPVPGGHLTCVTLHIDALAREMRDALPG